MWIYSQSTGKLWNEKGLCVGEGYSGYQDGKNNPALEAVRFKGPIPRGLYVIGDPYDSEKVGPHSLPLTPSGHNARSRTDFVMHGDSASRPGEASKGCIILARYIRELVSGSNDRILNVIE